MPQITIKKKTEFEVKYLKVAAGVRYWEDAEVDGIPDENGIIPCREGRLWSPVIDIETGTILGWPTGTTAKIHYKVCDNCSWYLLDENQQTVVERINWYVPDILCPEGQGYGDYIIMNINAAGVIDKWDPSEIENLTSEVDEN